MPKTKMLFKFKREYPKHSYTCRNKFSKKGIALKQISEENRNGGKGPNKNNNKLNLNLKQNKFILKWVGFYFYKNKKITKK